MEQAMERPKKWRKDRQGVKIEARREVVDNKAKEEAERKANEEADRKTKEEAERNAKEEADNPKIGK